MEMVGLPFGMPDKLFVYSHQPITPDSSQVFPCPEPASTMPVQEPAILMEKSFKFKTYLISDYFLTQVSHFASQLTVFPLRAFVRHYKVVYCILTFVFNYWKISPFDTK